MQQTAHSHQYFSSQGTLRFITTLRESLTGRRALKCTQTLLVAQLDGSLDEGVQLFVFLEEAVLELAGLFCAHPEDL